MSVTPRLCDVGSLGRLGRLGRLAFEFRLRTLGYVDGLARVWTWTWTSDAASLFRCPCDEDTTTAD